MVLNCDSENGLSFETCGREWLLVTPRSASSSATGFEVRRQHAIERALRAQVAVFVEQRRVDFCRRQVHEPWLVEYGQHLLAFLRRQRTHRRRSWLRLRARLLAAVVGGARQSQCRT